MNNLPKEFFEWLRKLKHPHIVYLRERKEWFDLLPETCRIALVVEWLEKDRRIMVEAQPIDDWNDWNVSIFAEDAMAPFFMVWESIADDFFYKSRSEALKAGIDKALKLITE